MAIEEFLPVVLAGIAVAIGPFIAFTVYIARGRWFLWKAFLFGWGGWLIALLIRIVPVRLPGVFLAGELATNTALLLFYVAFASAMAGLFEEGMRYLFLDQRKSLRSSGKTLLSFGLGWGIGEAILIYVPSIALLPFLAEKLPSFLDILPGAIERNVAILAHIGFTFIVLRSVNGGKKSKRFLLLAMFLHFALNVASVSALILTQNAWLTEIAAALGAAAILVIAYRLNSGGIPKPR